MIGTTARPSETISSTEVGDRYWRWARSLGSPWVLWLLGLAVITLYGCLHFVVSHEATPLTTREQAFIESVRHLDEVGLASFYAYDAVPLRANLYGPVYPVLVSLVSFLEVDPYLLQRGVVAALLVAACVTLAVGLPRGVPLLARVLAAAFLYAAHVASPSIAAGPDTLLLLLYVMFLVAVGRLRSPSLGLVVATAGLVLLFFSKPYGILVWGGYVGYLLFFRSAKWAFANVAVSLIVATLLGLLISAHWPAYRFSVLEVHTRFATWFFEELAAQVRDFSLYHFALLILCAGAVWAAVHRVARAGSWAEKWRELRERPPSFALWMVLVATVALLGRLGWHGGAYLIYFYHLLLPPLLLVVFGEVWLRVEAGHWLKRALVAANLALTLYFLPPWPIAKPERFLPVRGVAWVDPVLEAWAMQQPMVELIDNAQSEYLVFAGLHSSDPEIRQRAEQWSSEKREKLISGDVRYVVFSAVHNRPLFSWGQQLSPLLLKHYQPVHSLTTYPYFLLFRDRRGFGRVGLTCVVLEYKHGIATAGGEVPVSP
jgi:hypothetical protein